jgi:hypothetical protein
VRTSGVKLVADVSDYKRNVRDAAGETDKLKASIDGTGMSSKATGRAVDGLGGDFRDTGRDARALKAEIREVEGRLHSLAREFAATGDAAARLDISKSMRRQQGELRQLLKVEKLLPTPAEVQPAARNLGSTIAGFAGKGMAAGPLVPVLAGVAIAAAPVIGGTIAAAVIGGVGVGGVVGGLTLAAKDPRVQEAAKAVGGRLQSRLKLAASSFIDPAIDGLGQIESAIGRIDLVAIFGDAAKFVKPLAQGVSSAIERLGSSAQSLIRSAGPVIDVISNGIADLGDAVGDVFTDLADDGVSAATALRHTFQLVEASIRGVGMVVNGLVESYGFLAKIGAFGRDAQLEYFRLAANAKIAAEANAGLKGSIDAAAGAARGELAAMVNLSKELKGQTDPAFALINAQDALKKAQNEAAAATKKHGRNSEEARQATRALAMAALDMQAKAGALGSAFDGNLTPAMRATYRAAGLTEAQINDVERELNQARGAADKYAGSYKANVILTGTSGVRNSLDRLLIQQQALKKGITISAAASAFNKNAYHSGGWTGPGSKYQEAGVVHADEFVIKKESRQKIESRNPGLLEEMNATGQVRGYAAGGLVWPFRTTAAMTRIPSMKEALAAAAPSFGNWPSSPGAQRGDSGVWRSIVRLIRGTGPLSGSFGNGYRPGDPLWHGSGRAVDWMGYNQDALARFLAAKRPLELIHRTRNRDYAYTRGRNRGSFNEGLMNAHRNHIHIAMGGGGVINEHVLGVGASGATYEFGEGGRPETVTPGITSSAGGGTTTVNHYSVSAPITIQGSNLSPQQIATAVNRELGAQFNQLARGV